MWHRPHKPSSIGSRKRRTAALACMIILIFAASVWMLCKTRGTTTPVSSSPGDLVLKRNRFVPSSSVGLNPSTAFRNGTDVIWQIPSSPKAALFIAHGCNGRAGNFWDRSPACPNCVGLPEERLVVLHALRRRFAVLAVSSLERCWTFRREMGSVKGIIEWWTHQNGLQSLPLVALGASSGGYFVSALATKIRFSSIALMIAEGLFHEMGIPDRYPPTLFVHMPKDRARESMIRVNVEALRRKGVDAKEISCMEFALTPDSLSERIPGLDRTMSVRLFEMLCRNGFVDEKGFMRKDGRATRWRQAVGKEDPSLELVHHIEEELNLAYAYHEMTSLQMEDILSWFESHLNRQQT